MSEIFQTVVARRPNINTFNLTHENKLSGQMGKLIPVLCKEVVPGDRFKCSAEFLTRFAPMLAPIMHRVNLHMHAFYVPYRIITETEGSRQSVWENFIASLDSDDYPTLPQFKINPTRMSSLSNQNFLAVSDFAVGSLWDYLGLPVYTGTTDNSETSAIQLDEPVSLLPFLAYQRIYEDFYRRSTITPAIDYSSISGIISNSNVNSNYGIDIRQYIELQTDEISGSTRDVNPVAELFKLRTRNYERDYFTSALLEPQRGEDVTIGYGEILVEDGTLTAGATSLSNGARVLATAQPYTELTSAYFNKTLKEGSYWPMEYTNQAGGATPSLAITSGSASMSDVSFTGAYAAPVTIADLRLAMQLQAWRETSNRGGTRYIEIIYSHFGVLSDDASLQRPQYLGGIDAPISVGEVLQTSQTSEQTPLGNMAGRALTAGGNMIFKSNKPFKEHGLIMIIMSITPRTAYYGGIPKMFRKLDPLQHYWPAFDHLGEEEIKKEELYFDWKGTKPAEESFGYTPRYSDLKSSYSEVHGEFRTTLDFWHLARRFDGYPSLNTDFIQADRDDFTRVFEYETINGTSNEDFYAQILFKLKAKRPMSRYSTPYAFY